MKERRDAILDMTANAETLEETSTPEERTIIEEAGAKRASMLADVFTSEAFSAGLNFIPVIGGVKMSLEGLIGKTLSQKGLVGKERIIHTAVGVGSLALDAFGVGELGKDSILIGKSTGLVQRVSAFLAKKGMGNGARIFSETATFMAAHPDIVGSAELAVDTALRTGFMKTKKSLKT
ncbi:MAG: hypothetical protein JO026_00780 [Patescibacteria group bacterium]|nr:hypothetical protein [Patescibacteria group bacterium]